LRSLRRGVEPDKGGEKVFAGQPLPGGHFWRERAHGTVRKKGFWERVARTVSFPDTISTRAPVELPKKLGARDTYNSS